MTKASFYLFAILTFTGCANKVDSGVEVKFNDKKLIPLFNAVKTVNRDSMGFATLDSTAQITYKEEYRGTLIKLFFEKPDYITILYFDKSNKGIVYQSEEETTKGPRKMFVKDVDDYKTEIQETINRRFDRNRENNFGKMLYITFLDIDKYPDKLPYNQDTSVSYPSVEYETEISLEQSKEVISRWKSAK